MEELKPGLEEIPVVNEIYFRVDTKTKGSYNIMYTKKNAGETENAIQTEIKRILIPDEHLFEQQKLMGRNSENMSSSNSISSSSNPSSSIFFDKSKCKVSETIPAEGTRTFTEIVKQVNTQQKMKLT